MCVQYTYDFKFFFTVWPINRQWVLIRRLLRRARIRIKRTRHGTAYSSYYYWHDHNIIIAAVYYTTIPIRHIGLRIPHTSTKCNISYTLRFVLSKWLKHVICEYTTWRYAYILLSYYYTAYMRYTMQLPTCCQTTTFQSYKTCVLLVQNNDKRFMYTI